ncbi:rRNA N6-adenosine-methyltransferase METTL5 [Taenia solium]|eukprot:TsM_000886400 transcript=TsM_000886400 gene=TsM_000886400
MSHSRPSKKKLHMKLQDLESFSNPKQCLEQYPTSAHVAGNISFTSTFPIGDILFDIQTRHGALEDKVVGDLGCGPGMLALGAHLLGASFVVGYDIDEDAIADFQGNLEENFLQESAGAINLVLCDVTRLSPPKVKPFDTVITNPPFGTLDETKGTDIKFLKAALSMSREHVYSLHKTATRQYITKTVQEFGANCEVIAELRFDIPKLYKKHRQTSKDIAVDLVHSWFEGGVS